MRVYLAGPEVFLADADAVAAAKRAICAAEGLTGVFPLEPPPVAPDPALPEWRRIYEANEAHIRSCDALIANLTPFRGTSADVGTVYELGLMQALGRPVFGYSNVAQRFGGGSWRRWAERRGGGRTAHGKIQRAWRSRNSIGMTT